MENCELKYHFEKVHVSDTENKHRGMMIWDLCWFIDNLNLNIEDFLVIDSIIVEKNFRNNGLGSKILKDFCEDHSDKIIVLMSGAHDKEYLEEPSKEEYNKILKRLEKFYTQLNFINVNNFIGNYEHNETFIYKNKNGELLLTNLN